LKIDKEIGLFFRSDDFIGEKPEKQLNSLIENRLHIL